MEANVLLVLEITMTFAVTLGRFLLGLYFLLPGMSKITGYADTLSYMSLHNIPLPEVLLPVTILLQVAGGLMLMLGLRVGQVALVLAALTLIINLGMHDFWNVYEGVSQAHETQNFVKNLAIFAGLLVLSGAEDLPQHRLFGGR
jgi:putative oxidoreductase